MFFGQEHFDTQAIVTKDIEADQIRHLQEHTRLNNNREALLQNLRDLIAQLSLCETYIKDVLSGKKSGNIEIANQLNASLGCLKEQEFAVLEQMLQENFDSAFILNTIAKLQQAQVRLSERINEQLNPSISTGLALQ